MQFLPAALLAVSALVSSVSAAVPLQADVTAFLNSEVAAPSGIAYKGLVDSISYPGTAVGSVIASPSKSQPDYFYHWIRDGALVMDAVNSLYANGDAGLESKLWDYLRFYAKLQKTQTQTGLGEPKYYVDGRAFNDGWCRPQSDGPALTASTLIRFSKAYLAKGGDANRVRNEIFPVVKASLDYVAANWGKGGNCDLWEEVRSDAHFYTRMVQRRAFVEGIEFAKANGDAAAADNYGKQSWYIGERLDNHWDAGRGFVVETLNAGGRSGLNAATLLASIHTDTASGGVIDQFSPTDDRIQATIPKLVESFKQVFPINGATKNGAGLPIGPALGRYSEDIYNGINTSEGNPWFLCTLANAEIYYRMIVRYKTAGTIKVTDRNLGFFRYIGVQSSLSAGQSYAASSAQFNDIVNSLAVRGDELVRRVQYHSGNGRLTEQYSKYNGFTLGARDLTWSYAAVVTADLQRNRANTV
ncbi:Six-hairpin glycosidase-like protein [Entophlyctis helioformis]|nr:Six-hairpin glycosidase-like protein [Entophlyctis helioformis]